ncbi:MAG TPA: tRNA (adenosine(37)-N6)-threonylcarbamoyltransferase complex ATPase subunit type 1 TsaE [Planctomycetota bacterium]|nr:tRNA (adenosine(37)-N6)-threonylcarbamoyltransferase complex ATPase subunit type 1 TsaE [Planctomycetota bacterium]
MSTINRSQVTHSPDETRSLAFELARSARGGDLIFLIGDLGAGKTTFVRGFVEGLGHPEPREVSSPTFAIHHIYEGGRLRVHHLDLYRLESDGQMGVQGVLDPLDDASAVCLVEWSEYLPAGTRKPSLCVELSDLAPHAHEDRMITLSFQDASTATRFFPHGSL